MTIFLYRNIAEPNRVDKSAYMTQVRIMEGTLRDECSMTAPTIVFESDEFPLFNYVYIAEFARYYFVTGIDSVSTNLWRMRLNCDVLMTYRMQIVNLSAIIDRQENDFNPMLNDPNVPAEVDEIIETLPLTYKSGARFDVRNPSTANDAHFVLTTIGGGS